MLDYCLLVNDYIFNLPEDAKDLNEPNCCGTCRGCEFKSEKAYNESINLC